MVYLIKKFNSGKSINNPGWIKRTKHLIIKDKLNWFFRHDRNPEKFRGTQRVNLL